MLAVEEGRRWERPAATAFEIHSVGAKAIAGRHTSELVTYKQLTHQGFCLAALEFAWVAGIVSSRSHIHQFECELGRMFSAHAEPDDGEHMRLEGFLNACRTFVQNKCTGWVHREESESPSKPSSRSLSPPRAGSTLPHSARAHLGAGAASPRRARHASLPASPRFVFQLQASPVVCHTSTLSRTTRWPSASSPVRVSAPDPQSSTAFPAITEPTTELTAEHGGRPCPSTPPSSPNDRQPNDANGTAPAPATLTWGAAHSAAADAAAASTTKAACKAACTAACTGDQSVDVPSRSGRRQKLPFAPSSPPGSPIRSSPPRRPARIFTAAPQPNSPPRRPPQLHVLPSVHSPPISPSSPEPSSEFRHFRSPRVRLPAANLDSPSAGNRAAVDGTREALTTQSDDDLGPDSIPSMQSPSPSAQSPSPSSCASTRPPRLSPRASPSPRPDAAVAAPTAPTSSRLPRVSRSPARATSRNAAPGVAQAAPTISATAEEPAEGDCSTDDASSGAGAGEQAGAMIIGMLLTYDDPSGKLERQRARAAEQARVETLIEAGSDDAAARAMLSRRRVGHLLAMRHHRAFTATTHRQLSDLFMQAVAGHKLGHGAMSEVTRRGAAVAGAAPSGAVAAEDAAAAAQVERPFEWCGMGQGQEGADGADDGDAMLAMQSIGDAEALRAELTNKGRDGARARVSREMEASPPSTQPASSAVRAKPTAGRKARVSREMEAERSRQQHIDTARMDFAAFLRLVGILLGEWDGPTSADASPPQQLVCLADRMWPDATQGLESAKAQRAKGEDVTLSFQDVTRYFAILNSADFETRAAFMFDLFDVDDSGAITMRELSELIHTSAPGSIVEQDLLALSRTAQAAHKRREASGEASLRPKVRAFVFEDYLEAVRASQDAGTLGIVEKICLTLRMAPTPRPTTSELRPAAGRFGFLPAASRRRSTE